MMLYAIRRNEGTPTHGHRLMGLRADRKK